MEEVGGEPPGPFEDLEVIRVEVGVSTVRFCRLVDMPERDLAQVAGQGEAGRGAEGIVAPAGSYGCIGSCGRACVGQCRSGGIARFG